MSYAAVFSGYGHASIFHPGVFAKVASKASWAMVEVATPLIHNGLLYDRDTGAYLYDADTGVAITA